MGEATNEISSVDEFDRSEIKTSFVKPKAVDHDQVSDTSQEATQIRSGIEKTRANLSETIDALQDKLDPVRIAEQVKDQIREKATEAYDSARNAVKEATIGRAEKIVSSVSETVSDMTGRAGAVVSESSSSVVQYIRDNPFPFALLGIGVGMLALNKRRTEQPSYTSSSDADVRVSGVSDPAYSKTTQPSLTDRARDVASGVADNAHAAAERTTTAVTSAASTVRDAASRAADTARQQYHDVKGQARRGTQAASDRFQSALQDNPMAVGFAALAAGALVGLTMPSTRVEGEYMGQARDRFVDQAKSVAQEAAVKVQRVTEEAGRTFKDAAQKEGLAAG